jgi:hypothetical protein
LKKNLYLFGPKVGDNTSHITHPKMTKYINPLISNVAIPNPEAAPEPAKPLFFEFKSIIVHIKFASNKKLRNLPMK